MTYTQIDPTLLSVIMNMPIKSAGTTGLFLIEDDLNSDTTRFMGAMILEDSESPFDLVALMDVTQIRRLSKQLWEMANHLIQVRIDIEIEEQEKRKPKKRRRK